MKLKKFFLDKGFDLKHKFSSPSTEKSRIQYEVEPSLERGKGMNENIDDIKDILHNLTIREIITHFTIDIKMERIYHNCVSIVTYIEVTVAGE